MAFYLIGDVTIKDEIAYEQYRVEASKLISKHRGKYLVRGGKFEVVSGNWRQKICRCISHQSRIYCFE